MSEEIKKREYGGARKGAGRHPIPVQEKKIQFTLYVPQRYIDDKFYNVKNMKDHLLEYLEKYCS